LRRQVCHFATASMFLFKNVYSLLMVRLPREDEVGAGSTNFVIPGLVPDLIRDGVYPPPN